MKILKRNRCTNLILFLCIVLGCCLGLFSPSLAEDVSISVIDAWVEDGFEFHVGFEATPSNASCKIDGEGIIEFEVSYSSRASHEIESVFGLTTWLPAKDLNATVKSYGKAIGPQGFCTEYFPCQIRSVHVVKAWCPPSEGPLYPPSWF